MEFTPDTNTLFLWLTHYGSFVLFGLLALGILALPVPEETLMVLSGALIRTGKLSLLPTVSATYLGCLTGITMSYILGRVAGKYLIKKFGPWVGFTEARLEKTHAWFQRYGKWALPIGYFVPGIRHFTGFTAGMTYLEYKIFALFAYCGAVVWATLFLSIGYFSCNYCLALFDKFEIHTRDIIIASGALLALIVILYLIKKKRK